MRGRVLPSEEEREGKMLPREKTRGRVLPRDERRGLMLPRGEERLAVAELS